MAPSQRTGAVLSRSRKFLGILLRIQEELGFCIVRRCLALAESSTSLCYNPPFVASNFLIPPMFLESQG